MLSLSRIYLTGILQIGWPLLPPYSNDLLIRAAVIDDTLPVSPNGDVLGLSTGSSHALWPRLLEKAVSALGVTVSQTDGPPST